MCGFFQVVTKGGNINEQRFNDALDSMRHRGPDDSGIVNDHWQAKDCDIQYNAASGHRRLAIIDLNPRSKQPFGNSEQSLLYNGEVYNYRDIQPRLKQDGALLQTTGDTEVLFESIARYGTSILPEFNGMWAFSFLDKSSNKLITSRDRYGKKTTLLFSR